MRWMLSSVILSVSVGCGAGTLGPAQTARSEPAAEHGEARAEHAEHGEHGEGGHADHDDEPLPTDAATVAKAATVRILQNESPGCQAEALGPVDVHEKMESTQKALEVLKLRAAALGADAVTGVDFEHGEGGHAPTHLSGMAVRCKDLLHGRAYDVVGEIKVRGAMGKEEDAFAQLREKARTMRCDLILGVKFEHGEGGEGEKSTLVGTGIRFRP